MKNKNLLIVGLMVLVFGVLSQAKMGTADNPGFDIINKTDKPIRIFVESGPRYGGKIILKNVEVKPAQIFLTKTFVSNHVSCIVDKDKEVSITIYTTNDSHKYDINPGGADVYVTFGPRNGTVKLYPQTGPGHGTKGVTEAGYPLSNIYKGELHPDKSY